MLVGQRVDVMTRDGVVPASSAASRSTCCEEDERKKVAEFKDMHIDIGAARRRRGQGDRARRRRRRHRGRTASSCPTSASCRARWTTASAAYVASRPRAGSPRPAARAGDVVAVAAVQEEIGFAGARTLALALRPDVAIVVDVTHATDAPGRRRARDRLAPVRLRAR